MESRIKTMNSDSIRRLCSGQVISSLGSVVKELVENSVDAKATAVELCIDEFGLDRLCVVDNGGGMKLLAADGACSVAERHATSKQVDLLVSGHDAIAVGQSATLGFRGEALHSIATVACMQIISKTIDMEQPECFHFHGSKLHQEKDFEHTLGQCGTAVTVSKIFEEMPVRRKQFENSKRKMMEQAVDLTRQVALAHPNIKMHITHRDGKGSVPKVMCATSGSGNMETTIGEVYGGRFYCNLLTVEWKLSSCSIVGHLSKVGHGRSTTDVQLIFVDNRPVDLPRLSKLFTDVFASCHPNATHTKLSPVILLHISFEESSQYDINLAPNKRKILIEREEALLEELHPKVQAAFQSSAAQLEIHTAPIRGGPVVSPLLPVSATAPVKGTFKRKRNEDPPLEAQEIVEKKSIIHVTDAQMSPLSAPPVISTVTFLSLGELCPINDAMITNCHCGCDSGLDEAGKNLHSSSAEKKLSSLLEKGMFHQMVIHGQFNMGFIIASINSKLFVIDQHAADEKYNYEQLMSNYKAQCQKLMVPAKLNMDRSDIEAALANKEELMEHGFIVEPLDESAGQIRVLSVPVLPYDSVLPHDVFELISQIRNYGKILRPLKHVWHSMATKACRTSIMIGTKLSNATMREIVDHLGLLIQPWNCPHGRPTLRYLGELPGGSSNGPQK